MRRTIEIIVSSFKMAMQELWKNKLRTFLSLFGITIGIFCIIGVLATVNSLQRNVQNDIKSLGNNTVFVDKWDYSGQIPWWKLSNRPTPKLSEMKLLEKAVPNAKNVAMSIRNQNAKVEYEDDAIENVILFGITEKYGDIQKIEVDLGRYLQQSDFEKASNNVVMGYNIAEKLFGKPEKALNKLVE